MKSAMVKNRKTGQTMVGVIITPEDVELLQQGDGGAGISDDAVCVLLDGCNSYATMVFLSENDDDETLKGKMTLMARTDLIHDWTNGVNPGRAR